MSRRMLDSSVWSNENFAALPPRGRLLQIGMISIADDQGRLKANPLYLAKEIFPYDHMEAIDISKWLHQMEENGTIQIYMVEGKLYAQFLKWWEYQSLQFAKQKGKEHAEHQQASGGDERQSETAPRLRGEGLLQPAEDEPANAPGGEEDAVIHAEAF